MPTCRICQHTFKSLKFQTEHIDICTRCVGSLNRSPVPAKNAEAELAEMLARGMQRNAERDLLSDEEWKRRKAQRILADLDSAVADALHDWITYLLKKPENSTRNFKIMRAHRRGLLRMDGSADYPGDWIDVARRIRRRDGYKCVTCGAADTILDVHHIIYLSHHGTNQQSNLVTLCRKCHEAEHEREFDWMEATDPESASPIRPPPGSCAPVSPPAPSPVTPPEPVTHKPTWTQPVTQHPSSIQRATPPLDLACPRCSTQLTAKLTTAVLESQRVRCPSCTLVFNASDGLDFWVTRHDSRKRASEEQWVAAREEPSQVQSIVTPAPAPPPTSTTAIPRESTKPQQQKNRTPAHLWKTDLLVFAVILALVIFSGIRNWFGP